MNNESTGVGTVSAVSINKTDVCGSEGKIESLPLFVVPLWHTKVEPKNIQELKQHLKRTHSKYMNSFKINSVVRGDNTSHSYSLIKDPVYADLKEQCENVMSDLFVKFGYKNVDPYICDIWSTCTKPMEKSCKSHKHCNSIFSAVWYPFENNAPISFDKPNCMMPAWEFDHNGEEFHEYNLMRHSPAHLITPSKNTLLIFDSEIYHQIMPNNFNHTRFSIAMNFFVRGKSSIPTGEIDLTKL